MRSHIILMSMFYMFGCAIPLGNYIWVENNGQTIVPSWMGRDYTHHITSTHITYLTAQSILDLYIQ